MVVDRSILCVTSNVKDKPHLYVMLNALKHTGAWVGVIIIALWALDAAGRPLNVHDIPVTRNLTGVPEPTREEYLRHFHERELTLFAVHRQVIGRDEEGTVVMAVNHRLLNVHEEGFLQYVDDLNETGYDIVLLDVEGGTPEEFKQLIIEEGGDGLVGAVLAGELPVAWFEQYEYFDNEEEPDNYNLREYPIDLFYMDVDGVWDDTSGNGIYDIHSGDREPEIWIGRLPGYNLSSIDEDILIAAYLDRIHLYRMGELTLPHRALNFIDDDWIYWADEWGDDVGLSCGYVLTEAHPETTSAWIYRRYLTQEGNELVQVAVHSTSDSHAFWVDNHRSNDYFRFNHLRDEVTPNVMFYNLFACSAMNLSRNLCLGALYAMGGPYGLGAVGSTKKGSMLFFDDYYRHLGDGVCFGESLRRWFVEHGQEPGSENWARSWFYGMTHFGDPTLTIPLGLKVEELLALDSEGDDDGIIDAGETVELMLVIINRGARPFREVECTVSADDLYIDLIDSVDQIDLIPPDEERLIRSNARIGGWTPDGYKIPIAVRMEPEGEEAWWDRVELVVRSPNLDLAGFDFWEVDGDGDELVGPGESGDLYLDVTNIGGDDLREALRFSMQGDFIEPWLIAVIPPVASAESVRLGPFRSRVLPEAEGLTGIFVSVRLQALRYQEFLLPISPDFSLEEEFDGLEPFWTNHYPLTEGYNDAWRWGEDAGEGSGGIAFGGPDSAHYPAHADAAFELPLMMMDADAVLLMRHKMEAEEDYDGGVVEVNRGEGWERAVPEGGYNGQSADNGSFPGGPCWNGSFDWSEARVHPGGPAGPLRIRFRFASDNYIEGNGWFIDRITVTGTPLEAPVEVTFPYELALERIYPNPFNSDLRVEYSLPTPGRASLVLFDASGRRVAGLMEGFQTAGNHSAIFDGTALPTGLYILRLQAGGLSRTAKVLLVK